MKKQRRRKKRQREKEKEGIRKSKELKEVQEIACGAESPPPVFNPPAFSSVSPPGGRPPFPPFPDDTTMADALTGNGIIDGAPPGGMTTDPSGLQHPCLANSAPEFKKRFQGMFGPIGPRFLAGYGMQTGPTRPPPRELEPRDLRGRERRQLGPTERRPGHRGGALRGEHRRGERPDHHRGELPHQRREERPGQRREERPHRRRGERSRHRRDERVTRRKGHRRPPPVSRQMRLGR